jgi:UDP-N-acetylglucosamine transferase subunit ALG13
MWQQSRCLMEEPSTAGTARQGLEVAPSLWTWESQFKSKFKFGSIVVNHVGSGSIFSQFHWNQRSRQTSSMPFSF